jgi:hypothetical protein
LGQGLTSRQQILTFSAKSRDKFIYFTGVEQLLSAAQQHVCAKVKVFF